MCKYPFADHHVRFWDRIEQITLGQPVESFAEFWGRGGAKSTTVELGVTYIGAKLKRQYVLYVSGTQDQADKHVSAISTFLSTVGVERSLTKYGHSKGWKRNQLRAANGFNVEALGLDVAVRGIKLDEFRPDLIIFDDVDNNNDSQKTIEKKIEVITTSIIPAGSIDVGIIFIQNLIHADSIATRLHERTADFMLNAAIEEPIPAVYDLEYKKETVNGRNVYRVIGGVPSWPGQSLADCEAKINLSGLASFLRESQHEVKGQGGFFFDVNQVEYFDELPGGELKLCRAWDLAATEGGGDYSVGILLAYNGVGIYVLDVRRVQFSSAKMRSLVRLTAEQDAEGIVYTGWEIGDKGEVRSRGTPVMHFNGRVKTRLPQDPGQAGKDQAEQFQVLLKGYPILVKPVTGNKATRAEGYAEAVNLGNVRLPKDAEWVRAWLREHERFREDESHEFDDQVDAGADAYNELCPKNVNSMAQALQLLK